MATADDVDLPIIIVGRGIFGICGAIECARRLKGIGRVVVVGKRNEDASTFDVSKISRGDYGEDELYTRLHDICIARWKDLEKKWGMKPSETGLDSFFHWTGVAVLSHNSPNYEPTSFENTSLATLHRVLPDIASKCTLFKSEFEVMHQLNPALRTYQSGYFNPHAGWIESGAVLDKLTMDAQSMGVTLVEHNCVNLVDGGLILEDGSVLRARSVVVACGAWTPFLLPETRPLLTPNGQPIFLFESDEEQAIQPWLGRGEGGMMGPSTLDIGTTGFYCFPYNKRQKVLKIGHHGPGYPVSKPMTSSALRKLESEVVDAEKARMFGYLETVSAGFLSKWRLRTFRLCQYCDTIDSHFLIDHVRKGVVVATGGSGHGFKFGPVIGELIADKVLGTENANLVLRAASQRFAWRLGENITYEKARYSAALPQTSKL